ncbi:MAG: amidohydrolase [Synergistaceae bacterium]|jgi:amidohydrolase|nr:amidohydrolase [Synergistaceae bacterium]
MEKIGLEAKALNEEIVALRQELHAHPELEHDLPFTEEVIVRELSKLGLDEIKSGQGQGHGVFATLKGKKPGPGKTLALRADMDALPIVEDTGLPFASTNGNMHACGHDAHVAMLLMAAKLLAAKREDLAGTVRFIFQPSEETINGALSMIASGALENPRVDEIIGLHTGNIWGGGLTPGQIGWRVGPMMASTSTLTIEIQGKGGHGATPHLTVDPIVIATKMISQLQTLVSREVSPFEAVVFTIGQITGGSAPNVIAGSCRMRGMIRSFDPKIDAFLKERIKSTVEGIAASMRGKATVAFSSDIPAVINDQSCALRMRDIVAKTLGEEWTQEVALPSSGAEDFAFYLGKVPGAFFYHCSTFEPHAVIGEGRDYPHHNAKFDINESVLWTGTAALAVYALNWQA